MEKMLGFSEDLVDCLKRDQKNDADMLGEYLKQSKLHVSQSQADYNHDLKLLREYQEKIVLSKQKAEEARSEVAESAELDFLRKELEEELQKERLLSQELRVITDEINDLEHQRLSVEERRKIVKKLKQDELKTEMKLAMYASVTKIIPNLDEDSKISGCIMDKEKEAVEYFEYDSSKDTPFNTCNSIWEKISSR